MHPDLEPRQTLGCRLRELPDAAEAPYDWREFQRRSGERARAGRGLTGGRAVAAAGVLALGVLAVWIRLNSGPIRPAAPQPAPPESTVSERWLESLPSEPAVVRVGTHAAVTGLEDRIAQLDDLLSAERLEETRPGRLLALQQERTRLVGALVQVRYAETLVDASR